MFSKGPDGSDWSVLPRSLFASRMPLVELDDGLYFNRETAIYCGNSYILPPGDLPTPVWENGSRKCHCGEVALKYWPWHPPLLPPTHEEVVEEFGNYPSMYQKIIAKAVTSGKTISVRTWMGTRIDLANYVAAEYTEDLFWEGVHWEYFNMHGSGWRLEEQDRRPKLQRTELKLVKKENGGGGGGSDGDDDDENDEDDEDEGDGKGEGDEDED